MNSGRHLPPTACYVHCQAHVFQYSIVAGCRCKPGSCRPCLSPITPTLEDEALPETTTSPDLVCSSVTRCDSPALPASGAVTGFFRYVFGQSVISGGFDGPIVVPVTKALALPHPLATEKSSGQTGNQVISFPQVQSSLSPCGPPLWKQRVSRELRGRISFPRLMQDLATATLGGKKTNARGGSSGRPSQLSCVPRRLLRKPRRNQAL